MLDQKGPHGRLTPMSVNHLTNKTLVITGAAGGFGSLLCRDALARGARVAALDVNTTALDTLAADLDAGDSLITIITDVTDLAAMSAAVAQTIETFGSVDVMVNNAGTMPLAFLADHADAAYRLVAMHRHQHQGNPERHDRRP